MLPQEEALGKAVHYTLHQWPKLIRFLDHSEIPLDNNRAASALRPLCDRTQSLAPFRQTRRCYASARLYSLVETSKASGLEPHAYFTQSHRHLGYVPVRTLAGNHTCLLAGMLAHNLGRELRITAYPQQRSTSANHMPLWVFEKLRTLQRKLIQRAGRLLRPAGKLVLWRNANEGVKDELMCYLNALALE